VPEIVSNSFWLLDNSAKKLQCVLLLKFKPHYVQQASVHFVSEAWVSLSASVIESVNSSHLIVKLTNN